MCGADLIALLTIDQLVHPERVVFVLSTILNANKVANFPFQHELSAEMLGLNSLLRRTLLQRLHLALVEHILEALARSDASLYLELR
jgi:hypothetical protein